MISMQLELERHAFLGPISLTPVAKFQALHCLNHESHLEKYVDNMWTICGPCLGYLPRDPSTLPLPVGPEPIGPVGLVGPVGSWPHQHRELVTSADPARHSLHSCAPGDALEPLRKLKASEDSSVFLLLLRVAWIFVVFQHDFHVIYH